VKTKLAAELEAQYPAETAAIHATNCAAEAPFPGKTVCTIL
jgi:hypothetical protein